MDTTYRPMSIGQRNIMYGRYLGNTCTHDLTIHSTWRAQIYDVLVYFSYTVWTPQNGKR